ncbi:gliding motility-associated-like protein [Winogradskyella eximia]|uniref:Gliding motility-associated-like protein n=1 Tax=Winogradskyella eximia TaxID=262006 RepID=A0A3D9H510_9FLAO|nr:gliding motility-associated-like protein [Winogradskyella eximia]
MFFLWKSKFYYTKLSIYLNVRNSILDLKVLIIFCISFLSKEMHAQLGFCQGNSGDPIFTETFGVGTQNTSLPAGTTTYTYANNQDPNDGFYTVSSTSNYFDWFSINDHTPSDTNGRMLIVNSNFAAGEFYKTTINGLCENTTYEFSSWLINLTPPNGFCGAGAIPVNVSFEIWDNTDTTLLASGTTGNIFGTTASDWNQYALVFQSTVGQTSIILKMINNASGGCGNDLAIDDIVFKSCGDSIDINDGTSNSSITLCSTQTPYSETITAMPDNTVFNNHFYQWQTSTDNVTWTDLSGETNASIGISGIISTTYFRAKVAEYAANLNNADCITFSDVYEIIVNQAPPAPTTACWETATFNDSSCSWSVTGTQPEEPTGLECWEVTVFNNATCSWDISGTQPTAPSNLECWETVTFDSATCAWVISGNQPTQPTVECWEIAIFNNLTCTWEVSGTQPLMPTGLACWETATFDDSSCSWSVTGTQPVEPTDLECWQTALFNTATCSWDINGTQPTVPSNLECWQIASFNDTDCDWEVTGSQPIEPINLECWQTTFFNEDLCQWEVLGTQPIEYREEFLFLCEDQFLDLEATTTINNPNYNWVSGEMTASLTIDTAGDYEVEITGDCLTEIITFNVELIESPEIESIETNGSSIVINVFNEDDHQYSLDGLNYQYSNLFVNKQSGLYTIYIKSISCGTVIEQDYFHFYIQKFITPNGDGKNDFFLLNVTQYFTNSELYIYDRYGKILFSAINRDASWDATFNGEKLPTSDYWYHIILDGMEYRGHFTVKY